MMCSVRELELGDEHDGIIELAADAPVGADLRRLGRARRSGDRRLDHAQPAGRDGRPRHRPRSRRRRARHAEAGRGRPTIAGTFPCPIEIRTDDPEGCPAFYGRVIRGVRNGPSPDWLQQRLKAVGQRPISALVDMTNYIMLSYGRPLHVYDLAKLHGRDRRPPRPRRRGGAGAERQDLSARSVDDGDRRRSRGARYRRHHGRRAFGRHRGDHRHRHRMRLFRSRAYRADRPEARPHLRRAQPLRARRRSRLRRDRASQLATAMAIELAGGEPSADRSAPATPPQLDRIVDYRPGALRWSWPASTCPKTRQEEILQRLGFDGRRAASPGRSRCRHGVATSTARPTSSRRSPASTASTRCRRRRCRARPASPGRPRPPSRWSSARSRRTAAARGLNEAVTWSFISEAEAEPFGGSAWMLANPISEEMKAMRPSLLPGLLAAARAQRGARRRRASGCSRSGAAISATASVRRSASSSPASARARTGGRARRAPFDAFDAKAEAMAMLAAAGAPVDNLQVLGDASARLSSRPLGAALPRPEERAGRIRRAPPARSLKAFDLDGPVVAAEIFLDAIPQKRADRPHAQRLCAAAAAGGDARLRLPRARATGRRPAAARGPRRRQGGDRRRRACSTSSPARACPRGRSRSRSR